MILFRSGSCLSKLERLKENTSKLFQIGEKRMKEMRRYFPVSFETQPVQTELRGLWRVALKYPQEGKGPHLIDLSHKPKWDVQSSALDTIQPFGVEIPKAPGQCTLRHDILVCRMNATQTRIIILGKEEYDPSPTAEFTDISEGYLLFALAGPNLVCITEKLTALNLHDPRKPTPYLFQGPFAHVLCQVVVMKNKTDNSLLLLSCSRGYARDMVDAVLAAGKESGLRPAGEAAFHLRLMQHTGNI